MASFMDKITGYFSENGLGLLGSVAASVATGNPAPLIAKVASTLGTDPTEEAVSNELSKNNPETLLKLRQLESNERVELERMKLDFERGMEADKHADRADARDMYKHDSTQQKTLVQHAMVQFYFVVIAGASGYLVIAEYIPDKGLAMAMSSFIASAMTLVTNRMMTIDNFFFGSSSGSKQKTHVIGNGKQ